MAEKPEPDLGPVDSLQVTTPDTPNSNKDVRVEPRTDSDALLALKQMEKLLSGELAS